MCYHISIPALRRINELIGPDVFLGTKETQAHHVSAFSFSPLPVLTMDRTKELQFFHWGLIPSWCANEEKAQELRSMTLNAKSESIFERPSFRQPILKSRCLVFTDGFYEWREFNKKKYPYFIRLKNQDSFCMAGIYDQWVNKATGELIHGCSIVTTTANSLMEQIHNTKKRMPVILTKEQMDQWIAPQQSKSELEQLMAPIDPRIMQAHPISKLITSRTHNPNVAEVKEEFRYPELPELIDG